MTFGTGEMRKLFDYELESIPSVDETMRPTTVHGKRLSLNSEFHSTVIKPFQVHCHAHLIIFLRTLILPGTQ